MRCVLRFSAEFMAVGLNFFYKHHHAMAFSIVYKRATLL
jgi:hypothetical protein